MSFSTPVGPNALAVADFNGNKILDIAVACNNASSQDLAILSGNGGGGFMAPVTFAVRRNPTAVVTHDFDGRQAGSILHRALATRCLCCATSA